MHLKGYHSMATQMKYGLLEHVVTITILSSDELHSWASRPCPNILLYIYASFLRYTGYLNFLNGPISRALLLNLVQVQLLSCLFVWLLASLRLKTMSLNIAQQFMKGIVKIYLVF